MQMLGTKIRHRFPRQQGAEIVEFLITVPLILFVMAVLFDFGALFSDQIVLTSAARAAAREVIDGGTDAQAQQAANQFTQSLLPYSTSTFPAVTVVRAGTDPGDQVTVTVNHNHSFLILPNFVSSAVNINLRARVSMNMLP